MFLKNLLPNKCAKHIFSLFFSFALTCSVVTGSYALNIIPSNSDYYYRMGGGSDISMPPVTDQRDITLGGDTNINLSFTCDGFNPGISLVNSINNIRNSAEGLDQDVINSATAAIATLPMYLFEKASPEGYNLLQNTITHSADTFHLSMDSCQDSLNQISTGKSPYQNWFSISDSQGWMNYAKQAQQGQDVDINAAKKQITKDPEQYGIPWVHKGRNSGGTTGDQVPIKVIYDVVVAGYNAMIDKDRAADSQAPAPKDSELAHFWATPQDAGSFAQLVLGDVTISSKKGDDETHAGVGLVTILKICPNTQGVNNDLTCAKDIKQRLIKLVQSNSYPSAEDLQKISSNEMMITPDVIASIRNRTTEEQAVSISKISEDVSIQNLVDEALLLRRILIAGSQTKSVQNVKAAMDTVQRTMNQLDNDIKDLKFEHDIKQEFTSNTLETILENENIDKLQASQEHDQTQQPEMQNGAVYKK